MNKKPIVDIGMPVHNGQEFIAEALDSILAQTFENFRIIICDNASTDNTEEWCRKYAKMDNRVFYYRNEINIGAAKNFNRTFHLSDAKYFKWAAADDICAPSLIEECVTRLEKNDQSVLCYAKTKIINKGGDIIGDFNDQCIPHVNKPRDQFKTLLYGLKEAIPIFGVMRHNILKKTGLIRNFIASDKVLLIELGLYGEYIEIPKILFYRRDHPRASTRSHHDQSGKRDDKALTLWYDPNKSNKRIYPWWKKNVELFKVTLKSPVAKLEKGLIIMHIFRYMIWHRDLLFKEILKI